MLTMRNLGIVLLLMSMWPVRGIWAAEVEGVYDAEVPVTSQASEERTTAMRLALGEVLVKATGRGDVVSAPGIAAALDNVTQYVQQFRYRNGPADPAAPPGSPPPLLLWVRFDPHAVDHLLRSTGLPVWGRARPVALLWLAVQSQGRRELIGADSQNEARQLVAAEATRRGLPLRLPLLDLADQSALSVSDVWGGFQDTILKASARYQAEAVFVARVYQDRNGLWHGRWGVYQGGSIESWETQGGALAEVLDAGIDHGTDVIALRFAQVVGADSTGNLRLQVDDVKTLADYTRVVDYLSSLQPIKQVEPAAIQANSVTFKLIIRGDSQGVAQAVSLGHTLIVAPAPMPNPEPMPPLAPGTSTPEVSSAPVADLVYRLVP